MYIMRISAYLSHGKARTLSGRPFSKVKMVLLWPMDAMSLGRLPGDSCHFFGDQKNIRI